MKIVLVSGNRERQGFPPLGILYLSSYILKYSSDTVIKVFDCIPTLSEITSESPDIVGISSLSLHYTDVCLFIKDLRSHFGGPIILGGAHVTLEKKLPDFFDIAVLGEGESTFLNLVNLFKADGKFTPQNLKNIDGIMYRNSNGTLCINPSSGFIQDLDSIPFPARELIDMNDYLKPNNIFGTRVGRGTTLLSSRGCAYKCDYCSISNIWARPRYHSASYVADEISHLISLYGIELLYFCDDNFCSNLPRLRLLADEIESRNIKIDIGIMGRVDFFNDEISNLYKRIGITSISLGIETGSSRMLKLLKHGNNLSIEKITDTVNRIHNSGFELSACLMIGSPTETEDDMLQTLNLASKLPFSKIHTYISLPFIGTKWWDIAIEQGIVPNNPDWDYWKVYDIRNVLDERPIFTNTVSRSKLIELSEKFKKLQQEKFYFEWKNS
ncbi:MAG: B12-binding domain-containing radical SAM protein [Ignavibacteriales bacterium]